MVARVASLIAGVLSIVLPNIGVFHLPISVQATITGVGGLILSILVALEHPTVKGTTSGTVNSTSTTKA